MIQVISKALDILELLAKEPEKVLTLSDIANTFNLNHGTCANIIKSLVDRNYIEKLPSKKGYKLGMMSYRLGGERDYKSALLKVAKPEMEILTNKYNENSLLTILQGNMRVAILRVNSENHLQAVTPTEKEAYYSSTGRLLIALLSPEELDLFVQKYGLPKNQKSNKEISKTTFYAQLEELRRNGFAMLLPQDGILGIAVPIYEHDKVVASLSLYLPATRAAVPLQKKMLADLKLSAKRISSAL
jgi:DNA-binding IclR family transcriptional regulator